MQANSTSFFLLHFLHLNIKFCSKFKIFMFHIGKSRNCGKFKEEMVANFSVLLDLPRYCLHSYLYMIASPCIKLNIFWKSLFWVSNGREMGGPESGLPISGKDSLEKI